MVQGRLGTGGRGGAVPKDKPGDSGPRRAPKPRRGGRMQTKGRESSVQAEPEPPHCQVLRHTGRVRKKG